MGPLSIRSGRQTGVKHPKMKPGGMSDLTIPEYDPSYIDEVSANVDTTQNVGVRRHRWHTTAAEYCYDNGHTGDKICVACGEEIK